jgi:MFS family permease
MKALRLCSTVSPVKFPTRTLRATVVLPGAFMEGALAVLVPWLVAKATLSTPWLGLASAGVVLAAMLGTLTAPKLESWLGNRRMVVSTAFVVAVSLGSAAVCWALNLAAPAYAFILLAMAADAASDLGFASRMPVLARLSAQRLAQFSAANWMWSIGGAAAGSVVAGWALSADHLLGLASGLVWLSLMVVVGLALLLPRASRRRVKTQPVIQQILSRQLWSSAALKLAAVLVAVVFFVGPIDNLLLPSHLAARAWPANAFGDMLAATGLGLAAGLWLAQSDSFTNRTASKRRWVIELGLFGFIGQLILMLWLPQPWLLLGCLFLCAAMFAPLLPMLETAMLTVALPAQRTLMLAELSTLVGAADVVGTVSMGALISYSSSTTALSVCLAAAIAVVVCCVWPSHAST